MVVYFYPMVSLIPLTPADAGLLSQIGSVALVESHGHSAAPEVFQQYLDNNFTVEACLAELKDRQNIFYAIYYNNQLAGYYKISFNCTHPDVPLPAVTKMKQLYLLKEFYDLKLGHTMMQHAIDLSKAEGQQGMWLNVWKENTRAMRFYQKNGFEIVGEADFVLTAEHANPNWVMWLLY